MRCFSKASKSVVISRKQIVVIKRYRNIIQRCSVKTGVLKNLANFSGETLTQVVSCEICEICEEHLQMAASRVEAGGNQGWN